MMSLRQPYQPQRVLATTLPMRSKLASQSNTPAPRRAAARASYCLHGQPASGLSCAACFLRAASGAADSE